MAKEKRPAMPLYVRDILADEHFIFMSLAERGAYMTLLMFCWQEGSIPDDPVRAAKLCDCDEGAMKAVWPTIRRRFRKPRAGKRLIHKRVEMIRIGAEEARIRRINAAKIGAAKMIQNRKLHTDRSAPMEATASLSSSIAFAFASSEEEKKQFDVFRSVYALTGKPVNEGDWMAASVKWISLDLDAEADAIMEHLNALIGTTWKDNIRNREHQFIPAPANWLRKKPWTRQTEAIARYQ